MYHAGIREISKGGCLGYITFMKSVLLGMFEISCGGEYSMNHLGNGTFYILFC